MCTNLLVSTQSFSVELFNDAVNRRDIKALDVLIAQHPELINIQDAVLGDTLLHIMVESSMKAWAGWALNKGIPIETTNREGETALHVAANMDNGDMVDFLIEHGASVEARDYQGATPLQTAGGLGCDMALERLIQAGANPFAIDKRERSFAMDFLYCTAHREWRQALATADRIEGMAATHQEFGAKAWESIRNHSKILALNQERFPSLTCALEAAWLRTQQSQVIVHTTSKPRF